MLVLAFAVKAVALFLEIAQQLAVSLGGHRGLVGRPGGLLGAVEQAGGEAADQEHRLRVLAAVAAQILQHGHEAVLEIFLFGGHCRLCPLKPAHP